jgi:D-threonate/D-erythronate kinase
MSAEASSPDLAPPTFADSPSGRIVLLADDLTGACDAGAAFLLAGRSVRVWFGTSVQFSAPESVQAFNTNSRSLSPGRAAHVVSEAAAALGSDPSALFFKKIDSAARGPIAAEVLAAHRELSTRAILFAPAFPSANRVVKNGILDIQDAAGESKQIHLPNLFPLTVRNRIGLVSNPSELKPTLQSGKTILICDSTTQSDLDSLVRAAQELPGLLFAGSAGLAQALAGLNLVQQRPAFLPPAERTLVIVGSPHPVTKLQLESLDSHRFSGARVLQLGFSFAARARIRSAFRSHSPQALILTGGETAMLAVLALEAHSFILQGELAPGIPWGLVQGGAAHGCVVVTKSGGFGAPSAFNEILAALQGQA